MIRIILLIAGVLLINKHTFSQVEMKLLNTSAIQYTRTDEMRWWEWSITNSTCDTVEVLFSISLIDSTGVSMNIANNNRLVKDSSILVEPMYPSSFMLYSTLNTFENQEIAIRFTSEQMDTTFQLKAQLNLDLSTTPHSFPHTSSGLFRIHTGQLKNPQVIVMNSSRELIMENSSEEPFLDLSQYPAGNYIIQIGEDEFVVNKVDLLDSN